MGKNGRESCRRRAVAPRGFDPASLASAFEAGIADARAAMVVDVYATLDARIADALRVLPALACTRGCSSCCFSTPIVTALEWVILHRHLRSLDDADFARIADAAEMIRPLVPRMIALRQALAAKEPVAPLAVQCPFLIGGACSVYEKRPIICRAFGSTVLRDASGEPRYFASDLANAHASQKLPGKFHLPVLEPYLDRARALNADAKGISAPLPLWLFAHLDGRRLVPDVNVAPDFSALTA